MRRRDHQICDRQTQPGFTHWGSFAELTAVDWADVDLVALPDRRQSDAAAALGCRFATAYRAVVHVGPVRGGSLDAIGDEAACAASIAAAGIARHGRHAYPEMLALVHAGRLRPGRLVSARIALEQAPRALVAMSDSSPVGITVIRP